MTEAASIQRSDYQEIQRLISQYEKQMDGGAHGVESYIASLRTHRAVGLAGISQKDLPMAWDQTAKEHFVWEANLYKKVPEEQFEKWLSFYQRNPELFRRKEIRKKADKFVTELKRIARSLEPLGIEGVELYQSDIFKINKLRLGKAAAIITDPPYEKEALPLWEELVLFAGRTLREHGWLIAMSGQRYLPEVFFAMEKATKKAGLKYAWTLAEHTPGAQSAQGWVGVRNPLNTEWKPIIVYSKGTPASWPDKFRDFILSEGNDKAYHEWGQPLNVFKTLVTKFTQPTDLVADPFLGGGTTAVAAHQLGRAIEGFDIEAKYVATTNERVKNAASEARKK
jgi:site-specific DNA-methyltransferase (adenine-specific)